MKKLIEIEWRNEELHPVKIRYALKKMLPWAQIVSVTELPQQEFCKCEKPLVTSSMQDECGYCHLPLPLKPKAEFCKCPNPAINIYVNPYQLMKSNICQKCYLPIKPQPKVIKPSLEVIEPYSKERLDFLDDDLLGDAITKENAIKINKLIANQNWLMGRE